MMRGSAYGVADGLNNIAPVGDAFRCSTQRPAVVLFTHVPMSKGVARSVTGQRVW